MNNIVPLDNLRKLASDFRSDVYKRDEADYVLEIADEIEREKALKELVRDMWFWGYEGHMNSKSQDWQMKHIDGVLDRMKELGIWGDN